MALKRIVIGNLAKKKDNPNSRYLKVNLNPKDGTSVTLNHGEYINIESNEERLAALPEAVEKGRLSPETAEKIRAQIEKDAGFGVFAQAYVLREQ